MKGSNGKFKRTRASAKRGSRKVVLHEVHGVELAHDDLLLLNAVRNADAAHLRLAALTRLEEIRELSSYLHGLTEALLRLIHATRIGKDERTRMAEALTSVPIPRRSRASVERAKRAR
jgi:hypothetical protein